MFQPCPDGILRTYILYPIITGEFDNGVYTFACFCHGMKFACYNIKFSAYARELFPAAHVYITQPLAGMCRYGQV